MSNENIDIITLANRVANEKENIRQAIETRGVTIPETTPLADYPAKIMAIDTENTASDVYYRDPDFDTSATSFTLPGNYGVVADGALAGYTNLESVDLQYANAIFPEALADNTNLASFTGDHLKYVGNNAFASTGLEALNNSHIQRIDNGGFENCSLLESVSLPNCAHVGSAAFSMDTALESVSLPECTEVGSFAFEGDSMLTSINLPKVEKVPASTFRDCGNSAYTQYSRTIAIDMPACTSIGGNAFRNVNNIASINLPVCTNIGDYAFNRESSTATNTNIIDLSSVETIGNYNFVSYYSNAYNAYVTAGVVLNFPNCTSIGHYSFKSLANNQANRELIVSDLGCSIGYNVFSNTSTYVGTAGLYTNAPTKVLGKLTEVGASSFGWHINQSGATFNPTSVVNIDIDFSSIRYLRDNYSATSSARICFSCYNQGAANSTIGQFPYYNFTGGALDFSSFVDTVSSYGTSLTFAPYFFSDSGYSGTSSVNYSLRGHNVRKIWIPSTCNRIKIGLMGANSSDPIHIYTDASAAKSEWHLAGRSMNATDLGTTAYGVVHTNCTHQDFIDGTYNV